MKKEIFIFLIIILSVFTINAQKNSVKVDFSYMLTKDLVFKAGMEHRKDVASPLSYGLNLEFGTYQVNTTYVTSSHINDYQLKGFGAMPFARYYTNTDNPLYGFFVEGFVLAKKVKEISYLNIQKVDKGYDFSNVSITNRKGFAYNYGLAIGYRFGKPRGIVHVETLFGSMFKSVSRLFIS